MKKAMRILSVLAFAMSALLTYADQHFYATYCILPGDNVEAGVVTLNKDGKWITPAMAAITKGVEPESITFTATPPVNSGLRVQYWIVSPNELDICFDNAKYFQNSTRFDSYSETMTWSLGRSFATTTLLYVGARFYYITNSVSYHADDTGVSGATPSTGLKCFTDSYSLTPNGFSRTGYTFSNWTNETGKAFSDGQKVTGADLGVDFNLQDVRLYAVWAANSYSVHFNSNGGSTPTASKSVVYDSEYGTLPTPTRTGYTFDGWYTAESGGQKIESQTKVLITSDQTLFAHWSVNVTMVHFNVYDASTSGPSDREFVYGQTLDSIPIPTWLNGAKTFLGYYTQEGGRGECYWNASGQPLKQVWDIDKPKVTLYAHTQASVYHITYDPNGGSGAPFSVLFTNGVPIKLSDGSAFYRNGSELLGWTTLRTMMTPEYAPGALETFNNKSSNFDLYAVWKDFYYVAFEGNGATNETPMAVQRFAFGESQSLLENIYGRVGYTFAGWSVSVQDAASNIVTYDDREIVKDLEKVAGATNTLFASWEPISYVVDFDASEHSAIKIAPIECTCDVEFDLPAISYSAGELWKFIGWSNTVDGVVYFESQGLVVSNLCWVAGATNKLVAVWESMVGDLSKAMDIYNLRWENEIEGASSSWRVVDGIGHGTASCAAQTGRPEDRRLWEITTVVTNSGTLTFWLKSDSGVASLYYGSDQDDNASRVEETFPTSTEWSKVTINVIVEDVKGYSSTRTIYLGPEYPRNATSDDTLYIDQMTWTPAGAAVEPTEEDARDITAVSLVDGVLSLTFADADERFSYNLRGTNDLTAPLKLWPVLSTTNGTGTITVKPAVDPAEPKMFFYLETATRQN